MPPTTKKKAAQNGGLSTAINILKEDQVWGVRLILRPFADPRQNTAMEISADINLPKPNRSPDIKIWFNGVPIGKSISITDSIIWVNALSQMQEEARKVAATMKDGAATKKKKKKS